MAQLTFSIFVSILGIAYMAYGKRQVKYVPLLCGLALCVYTYFVDGWTWLVLIGAVLAALPFFVDG
ncbi:MAG TPA: amino acid transport protein [Casimicrobiaceae bacterium]|nr:amino acid transport protein [Casimicrobiaceae bacterium]